MTISNYLSIDVEDYFHVSAFENVSLRCVWDKRELRVEENTERILDRLSEANVKATFFVLGWVAAQCPQLIKRIAAEGHEVASHGFSHRRVCHQSREEFRNDIRKSKDLLEDLTGHLVLGYRAPSYSISPECFWAFDEILAAGYSYDSSIFPIQHDLYGLSAWPRFAALASRDRMGHWYPTHGRDMAEPSLLEVPITTLKLMGATLPIAGGGYFRLYPYSLTRWGLNRINQVEKKPFVFYLHPWEIDPDQPRMTSAGLKSRFRHYLNLDRTENRLCSLLEDFSFVPIRDGLEEWRLAPLPDDDPVFLHVDRYGHSLNENPAHHVH